MSFVMKALNDPVELGEGGSIFGTGYSDGKRRWHVGIVASRTAPALARNASIWDAFAASAVRFGARVLCGPLIIPDDPRVRPVASDAVA